MRPIGVVRTPFADKASAPRQPAAAKGTEGRIELLPQLEHAIDGLEAWPYIWVLFHFHQNGGGWRSKVLPPRSREKRGVLATRSPHRPNAVGLSVVRLERVEGLVLHVRDLDIVDGSPVLDIKPYVAYADAVPDAGGGWLEAPPDPGPKYAVEWGDLAAAQRAFLAETTGADPADGVDAVLAAGPEPHPYRRIKRQADGSFRLARRAWRYAFRVFDDKIVIEEIVTGYRPKELATGSDPEIAVHRAFCDRFSRTEVR